MYIYVFEIKKICLYLENNLKENIFINKYREIIFKRIFI